jgi:hypothetical protein
MKLSSSTQYGQRMGSAVGRMQNEKSLTPPVLCGRTIVSNRSCALTSRKPLGAFPKADNRFLEAARHVPVFIVGHVKLRLENYPRDWLRMKKGVRLRTPSPRQSVL